MNRPKLDFNIWQIIKSTGVAVLFTGAAILFYACENDIEKIKAFSSPENLPLAEATNFETMLTDSGRISFTLKAPKLLRFEIDGKDYIEFPEGMELKKYDMNGNVVSGIKSDYAKQFVDEDKWEAKNNVIATNVKGDTLKTEYLIWEREKGIIHSDEYVKIIRPDQIYTGIGFTSDENMEDWKILKPKGTIYVTVDSQNKNVEQTPEKDTGTSKEKPFEGELQFEK